MNLAGPVLFTRVGVLRGLRLSIPMLLPLIPFGLICGVLAQGVGYSMLETFLMSALVFAGSAQLVVLGIWTHPPDLIAVTFAAFVINLRMALMGPVLAPWLDHLRGWKLWGTLFVLVDQSWAMAVAEIKNGQLDAGFLLGSGLSFWTMWVASSVLGFALAEVVRPVPGHPLFFAALAVFVALLTSMWRGRIDLLPWMVAAVVSTIVAQLLPGTFWYIVAGALAGSVVAGVRDERRATRRSA
jgi:4-azaleucine resistance transporter AzlC